jgi:antitoxin (DNA-binding transcriptional repressor) of toxin-antitoxin stability system
MSAPKSPNQPISATEFKSHCLELINDIARGKSSRILLTKHNHPIAQIVPVQQPHTKLWGALGGTVKLSPGVDLTQPTGESWKARD